MRRMLLPLGPLLVSLLASPSLADLTIDNFEEGAFTFTGGNSPTSQTQTSLNPANTLGAQRVITILSLSGTETVSAELTLGPGDDAVQYTSATSGGNFSLGYNDFGQPTLDLTHGGSADRIEVVVAQADAPATLELELLDEFFGNDAPSQPVTGAGTYTFLFSGISGVDLSQIQILQVDLDTTAPGSFRIAHVSAAPPPAVPSLSPALLAACALVMLSSVGFMLARRGREAG